MASRRPPMVLLLMMPAKCFLSEPLPRICWYIARRSLESLGVDTTCTSLPVFLLHSATDCLHSSSSWPTAPQEIFSGAAWAPAARVIITAALIRLYFIMRLLVVLLAARQRPGRPAACRRP